MTNTDLARANARRRREGLERLRHEAKFKALMARVAKQDARLQRRRQPAAAGWCHPSNAVCTRCACGRVISLGRTVRGEEPPVVTCGCGRRHRKAPGGWRGVNNGGKRAGGRSGCPGC